MSCFSPSLNQTFLESIKENATAKIEIPDVLLIQFKEAVIFAFLGY